MPGVQSTYIKYELSGDQHAGHTKSGNPQDKTEFPIITPYVEGSPDLVTTAVRECFPNLCPSAMGIGEICLVSGWTKETFMETHFIHTTPLFSQGITENFKDIKRCHVPNGTDPFSISGIPPIISILTQIHIMMERVDQVVPRIERVVPEVVQEAINVLEE
jgi:hypothetical protein